MEHLYEKAQESAEYIKAHTTKRPKIAVVLGSGLGNLTADFTETEELPYKDIPNFPVSTVYCIFEKGQRQSCPLW